MLVTLFSLSYTLGSINSAVIICFILKKPSPTTLGSNNPGATNVFRFGGKKAATITLLGDMLKGFVPVVTAHMLGMNINTTVCIGLTAVIGHIFSIFWKFKGGKGVATLLGVMIGLYWVIGGIFLAIWITSFLITSHSSLAGMLAAMVTSIFIILYVNLKMALPFLIMALVITYRHHRNIKILLMKGL